MTVETGYEAKPCLAVLHPPLAVRPVPQRNQYDCGVAAMAMLLDLSYEDAEAALPYRCGDPTPWDKTVGWGCSPVDILWAGLRRGVPLAALGPREVFERAWGEHAHHLTAPCEAEFWDWLAGKRAVITTNAQNTDGGTHCVAWDGRYLIDPLYKRHRARHYQVMDRPTILEAVVRLDSVVS